MGDSWLQRLVVRGPAADVAAFRRAVASREKPQYLTVKPGCRTQKLSFAKLRSLLLPRRARQIDTELEEPWDLVVEPTETLKGSSVELTYKFQLSEFEPDDLILEVSKLYRRLCFVLGCVAPDVDEQSSRLIQAGRRSREWRLPAKRKAAIWKELVPEETDDNSDEVTWGLAEADWQFMDEVVAHWRPRMDTLAAQVLRHRRSGRRARHARRPGERGR
jgi:hypothetical protein